MSAITPTKTMYDYGLGIEPDVIDYIKESNVVESRISPARCYLYQRKASGSVVGTSAAPITVSSYYETDPYKAVIWASGSVYPDTRAYVQQGLGALRVLINSVEATRVLETADIIADNEFAVVQRWDLSVPRVELVFNSGFNAAGATVQYYYTSINQGVVNEMLKRGDSTNQSLFGWTQYRSTYYDNYQLKNQILVRMPINPENVVIKEEGKVTLQENDSWMIWEPYVNDFDLVIVPASENPGGTALWFEIQEKRDSIIQRTLTSQRFKLKLLEDSDPRTQLTIVTT